MSNQISLEWAIADDTDSNINYEGDWFLDIGNLDSSGSFGEPYLSTLHGIQGTGSLTYSFSGTGVILTGAIGSLPSSSSERMSWQCLVDGSPIQVNINNIIENRLGFCLSGVLPDGKHTLVVNVVATAEQTFWVDYVQYVPSPSASSTDQTIMLDYRAPQFQYSADWTTHFPGSVASTAGSKVSLSFTGTSVIWYGFYDSVNLPFAETSATYSIDGNTPTSFLLNGAAAIQTAQWTQILFQVNGVPAGSHTIEVVYQGNTSTAPLSVESVVFSSKDLLAGVPASGSPPTTSAPFSSPTSSTTTSTKSSQTSSSSSSLPSSLPSSIPTSSETTQSSTTGTGLAAPGTTVPSNNNVSNGISSGTSTSSVTSTSTSTTGSTSAQKHGPGNTDLGIILGLSIAVLLLLLGGVLVWRRRRKSYPTTNRDANPSMEVSPFWINSQAGSGDVEQLSGPGSDLTTVRREKEVIEQREQDYHEGTDVASSTRIGPVVPPPYYR